MDQVTTPKPYRARLELAKALVDAAPAEEPELMWASAPCFPSVPPSAELRGIMHDWMVTTPEPVMLPPGTTLEIIAPAGDRAVTVNGVALLPGEAAEFTAVRVDPERPELGCEWQRGGGAELEAAAVQGRAAARAGTGQIANPHGEGSGLRAAWAGGWCAETEDMAKAEGAAAFKAGVAFHDNPYRQGEWTPRDWLHGAWDVGWRSAERQSKALT